MADVNANRGRHDGRGRDRGQLILVTGLLVAVAMVGLVLLLNTAIYTENLASRGTDQSGREAVEYRATVVDGVGGLIDAENDRDHNDYGDVEDNVKAGIAAIDNYTARSYAVGGTVVRIDRSSLTTDDGRLIRQTDFGRAFTNNSDTSGNWTLATGVSDTRDFTIRVNETDLVGTGAGEQARDDGAFHVNLDGADDWQAFVYYNMSSNEVAVATSDGGTPTEVCSTGDSEVTIDLTRGTVGGEPCQGLRWSEGISGSYDIEFVNGSSSSGTYNLTINGTSVNGVELNAGPSTSPYYVPAVYSATFDVSYETPTLTYRSEVRVAPGEPR